MDLDTPDEKKLSSVLVDDVAKTGQLVFERINRSKDGSLIPVRIDAKLIDYKGSKTVFATVQDISKRKQSEQIFQSMIDNTSSIIYLKDVKGRYILTNHQYEKLFHVTSDEIKGKTGYDIFPKEQADAFRENDLCVLEANTLVELEEYAPLDDGIHTYLSVKFPLHDANGKPYGVCGISTDITQQKQHQLELENDRALFDAMSRAQSSFIADFSPKELFNDLLHELLKITQSEYGFIGQVLHDDDGHPFLKTFALTNIAWNEETLKFYDEKAPDGMEFRNLNSLFGSVMVTGEAVISNDPANDPRGCGIPKGHPPLDEFLGIPFKIGDKLLGMAGVSNRPGGYDQDIVNFLKPLTISCGQMIKAFNHNMARKLAEEHMNASEARLSGILDSAVEAVISIDESQHITLFNKGAEEIFGYEQDEILGQPLEVLLPVNCRLTHHRNVASFGKHHECPRFMTSRNQVEGQRKNGKNFPGEASISSIEIKGKKTFTAVLRDISERKEFEKVLRDSFVESIDTLMRAAEYRDDETGAHVRRISYYTKVLAKTMGMNDDFCHDIFYASAMHDIGKIGIPDHILLKPGGFTPEEWEIMKTHSIIGGSILAGNSSPYLKMGEQIALGHHERWDGSGYPNGIKGDAIPLAARIMQLADVYDALRSERPYKKAFDHARTLEIIFQGDGRTDPSHFDPAVLAAFKQCSGKLETIYTEH